MKIHEILVCFKKFLGSFKNRVKMLIINFEIEPKLKLSSMRRLCMHIVVMLCCLPMYLSA